MNGKDYSEGSLSKMIDAAHYYIYDHGLRDSIIAKCYQEIGLIVAGAPVHQRSDIYLTGEEDLAMRQAILRWLREREQSKDKSVR